MCNKTAGQRLVMFEALNKTLHNILVYCRNKQYYLFDVENVLASSVDERWFT